jgi:hypothetical protein
VRHKLRSMPKRAAAALLLCALGAGASALAGTSGAAGPTSASSETAKQVLDLSAPSASEQTSIYATATQEAGAAGEATPSSIEATTTTMGQAQLLVSPESSNPSAVIDPRSGEPWSDSAVYAVTMHGYFTLSQAQVPRGDHAPVGTVLTMMIDRASGDVVGIHLGTAEANLSSLNQPVIKWGTP